MSNRIPHALKAKLRQNILSSQGNFDEVYQTLRVPKFSLVAVFGKQTPYTSAILKRYEINQYFDILAHFLPTLLLKTQVNRPDGTQ
jgi:ABC-type antimicrobial peptide transport system permease subunit